jgi:ribose/xylose/arabinose/galactoside ABC-type transport system permease subunit/ABC-type sugar transport system substrate-binding protein
MMPEAVEVRRSSSLGGVGVIHRARVYLLCATVLGALAVTAPGFATVHNIGALLVATSVSLYAVIGFTLVMIVGQLDLSIGASMTLGGMLAIGLSSRIGWAGAITVASACGAVVGLANGLLVAKVRINSFIVTLGTMTILSGAINLYSKGGTLTVSQYQLADWLNETVVDLVPVANRVVVAAVVLGGVALALSRTAIGRGFYLVGGNRQTAWYSGLRVDRYLIGAFILSAVLSALGGAICAIGLTSANPTMGDKSLMLVIASVIIGGASMKGGHGSVVHSAVALLTLSALINGLGCFGAGFEAQLLATGILLALVVLYDARQAARENLLRGQRRELLLTDRDLSPEEGSLDMQSKDRSFAMVCVTTVGCVAIVAIFAMWFTQRQGLVAPPGTAASAVADRRDPPNAAAADAEVMKLKASDGQSLIELDDARLDVPPRPKDPGQLSEDDSGHWYDAEYSGRNTQKLPMPSPPSGGARGKRVMCLRFIDHPYLTAYTKGMQRVADVYGIHLKTLVANNDINIQAQQVDQAINEKPDLVIITPVDATAVVPLLRKLHDARVPVIASNLLPTDAGMPYVLTWTGPDDWGNFRMLAREFANRMNYEGGYCIVRHVPGAAPFVSRTFAMVTELKKIAPKMTCLDMQPTGLEAERTMQVTADWITRFGSQLKGIVSADDSGAQIGIDEACQRAGRQDIIRVAAGNSKVGMDAVKHGMLAVVSYQSAESDGALPMKLAADWLNGKPIDRPIYFLKKAVITQENVDQFLPPQW